MAYTPPAHGAVNFNFILSYSAPAHGAVNFDFSASITHTYTPTGGIVFGGSAPVSKIKVPVISGGITFGGAASTGRFVQFTYVPSGGITFGGAATYSHSITHTYTPSGGITFGGTAAIAIIKAYVTQGGGITFGGTSPTEQLYIYPYRIVDPFALGRDNFKRREWSL